LGGLVVGGGGGRCLPTKRNNGSGGGGVKELKSSLTEKKNGRGKGKVKRQLSISRRKVQTLPTSMRDGGIGRPHN